MTLALVAHYFDRHEALIVSGALDAAGIPNFVHGLEAITQQSWVEIACHGYRIMVVEADLADAVRTVREAQRKRSFEGERLSVDHQTALCLPLAFYFALAGVPFVVKQYKWHDVRASAR